MNQHLMKAGKIIGLIVAAFMVISLTWLVFDYWKNTADERAERKIEKNLQKAYENCLNNWSLVAGTYPTLEQAKSAYAQYQNKCRNLVK